MPWRVVTVGFARRSTQAAMCPFRPRSSRGILRRSAMNPISRRSTHPAAGDASAASAATSLVNHGVKFGEPSSKVYRVEVISVSGDVNTLYFFDFGSFAGGMACPGDECDPDTHHYVSLLQVNNAVHIQVYSAVRIQVFPATWLFWRVEFHHVPNIGVPGFASVGCAARATLRFSKTRKWPP
jgi:hypothetical protein